MTDEQEEREAAVAPDPDEDDLDDLDDMLDEFQSTTIEEPATSKTTAKPTATSSAPVETGDDEDFAKHLQAGMEELLGSLGQDPAMKAELETMMKELNDTAATNGASPTGSSSLDAKAAETQSKPASSQKKAPEDAFQETIRKTIERMQQSGDSAAAAAASSSEEDMFAQMLKEMEKGGLPGLDGGNEEDFNKMLMGMMEQLTNKDILYEPMKELHDKFPEWLKDNADKTKPDDLTRYKTQQSLVAEIVARFEKPGYHDDNKGDREFIVDRMQHMQAAGSPPPDLVGDMGSAQEMLGDLEGGCPTQ